MQNLSIFLSSLFSEFYHVRFPRLLPSKKGFDQLTLPAYAYAPYLGMRMLLPALGEIKLGSAIERSREALGTKLSSQSKIMVLGEEVPVVGRRIQFSLTPHVVKNYKLALVEQ